MPLASHGRAFVRAMTGDSERQPLLTTAWEGTTGRKSGAWASRLAGACGRDARIPDRDKRAIDPEGILAGPLTRVPPRKDRVPASPRLSPRANPQACA